MAGFELRPYQTQSIQAIEDEWEKGRRKTLLVLPTGCHARGQKVLLASGLTKAVEEIGLSDTLLGADGKPRKVLHLHHGKDDLYKITPIKGQPFIVNSQHMLSLVQTGLKGHPQYPSQIGGKITDVTVSEYLTWSKNKKHTHKLYRSSAIEQFHENDGSHISIDPYFLGVLLGDGNIKNSISITTMDKEIEQEIERQCEVYNMTVRTEKAGRANTFLLRCGYVGAKGGLLHQQLKELHLRGVGSAGKFIPLVYKAAPLEKRLEILAGVIDTDGSKAQCCGYDFISKSRQLSEDVAFIARSAGLAAYVSKSIKTCQGGFVGTYWRVSISGDCSIIPCRVKAKQCAKRKQKKSVLRTGFSVEHIGFGEYFGFTVDGDNRYLLDDFTVTHNCGKTIVFSEIAKRRVDAGERVLILAHRGELLEQAADKLARSTGLACAVEKAENTSVGRFESVVVGSVQTLMRQSRLDALGQNRFGTIIVDEAHHALSSSYRAVLDYFSDAKVLGVTATPDRGDRKDLGELFDSLAYEYSLPQAIKDGYLCPIEAQTIPLTLDLSHVGVQAGDFKSADLGDALEPYLEQIAQEMIEAECMKRKTVVFLPLIATSQKFCAILNAHGFKAAEVNGQSHDRAKALADFERGKYNVLCNSMLLTEGWDCPSVDCIIVLRPTKVRSLYCLDEKTEVLTRDGWKTDVDVGEDVLAFDTKTGETKFVPALAKVRRPLDNNEFFCSIKGQSTDIRVTNRHRMIYDNKRRKGWKIKEAQDIADMKDGAYIPVSGHGSFPGVPLSDAELTFIGWVMTDGAINKTNRQIAITQGEHQKAYCEEIERCLKECGFKFTRTIRKRTNTHWNAHGDCVLWTISHGKPRATDKDKTGWGHLEPWLSKDMSTKLFDMTERQFAVMLEAIFHGDGNKSNTKTYDIGKGNRTFIERLQAMAIQRGYRASVSVEKANEVRKCDLWHVHIKKQKFVKVGSVSGRHSTWTKELHTDEMCWCIENELGTLVTRRNGKVAIVGNCQMVGRGTRLSPETNKDKLLLLDFLWHTERHELCRPTHLIAKGAEVANAMTKVIEQQQGAPIDLEEVEKSAENDVTQAREESLAKQLAEMRTKKRKLVDPLQYEMSIMDADLQNYVPSFGWEMAPPSDKQLKALESHGIFADGIECAGKASMLLNRLDKRKAEGMSSAKQIRLLERYGFKHVGEWSLDQASRLISRLSANGWRVPYAIDPASYVPPQIKDEIPVVPFLSW
ncbi:MAG: DEAD/DEAH box helicase family protein [Atopobium minutum]|nr:DEAD/DEAH box helicase family protein [Atopobium minutum]